MYLLCNPLSTMFYVSVNALSIRELMVFIGLLNTDVIPSGRLTSVLNNECCLHVSRRLMEFPFVNVYVGFCGFSVHKGLM